MARWAGTALGHDEFAVVERIQRAGVVHEHDHRDSAIFAGTAGTVTLGANINAKGLTFSTPGYTIAGSSTLTIGAGGIDASGLSSGTTTISAPIQIAAGVQRWTVGAGSTLALGAIGAGGSATNTYGPNGAIVFISKGDGANPHHHECQWLGLAWRRSGSPRAGMVIDNGDNTYDWASANSGVIGAATYMAAGTGDKNNVLVTSNATVSLNASWASLKVSGATSRRTAPTCNRHGHHSSKWRHHRGFGSLEVQ